MQQPIAEMARLRPARSATVFSGGRLAKKRSRRTKGHSEILAHTIERSRHGAVERLENPISDTEGRISRPFRAIDTLATMERRGSISREMRHAGETFREKFNTAHLEALHAAPLERISKSIGSVEIPSMRIEAAKDWIWRAICAVGGLASHTGSCLWNVVGLEQTIKQWATEHHWAQETASGILIAALSTLEGHCNGPRNK